jgi:cysteine desulfurase
VSPSHVLAAIGVAPDVAGAAVRMSLGVLTTDDHVVRVAELFPALADKARRLTGSHP